MAHYYHISALLSGNRKKTLENISETDLQQKYILPFITQNGIITAKWGKSSISYKVLELRVFKTTKPWSKRSGIKFEEFTKNCRNIFPTIEKKAKRQISKTIYPVFIVMPIQGEKYGNQDQRRIFKEYDKRFEVIEKVLQKFNCVAVRIDKEYTLEELVKKIKDEISRCQFVIADLTDERPSCYFEAGFAEALRRPVIYIASKESVVNPKTQTRIHFDIHRNVNYFISEEELSEKVKSSITKNNAILFKKIETPSEVIVSV